MSFVVTRRRFSIEQIEAALRQHRMGVPVAELVRQLHISEPTFDRWQKVYGGLQLEQARARGVPRNRERFAGRIGR